jgi:hypothetical protein
LGFRQQTAGEADMDDAPLSETEQRLVKWDDPDDHGEVGDLMHRHFTQVAARFDDWTDVSHEGRRVWELMFGEAIEDWSAIDAILSGVAAAAYHLAVTQVSQKLGVSNLAVLRGLESETEGDAEQFVRDCKSHSLKDAHKS